MNKLTRKEKEVKLNDKTKDRVRLGYSIALSAILVVLGILFISSCYSIYKSGASPFTRESIGRAFSKIAIPTYLTIVAVIGGFVIHLAMPKDEPKLVGLRTPSVVLKTLSAKVNTEELDGELKVNILKERKLRKILTLAFAVLLVLEATVPLFYLLNPANFPGVSGEYNAEILHGMLVYLAFLSPAIVYSVVYTVLFDLSCKREIELSKAAIKVLPKGTLAEEDSTCPLCRAVGYLKKNEKPIILGVRIALVGCALLFIVLGVRNGGMTDVLNKAIKICTECIGFG